MGSAIEAVIFDLGGVLLDLDYGATERAFQAVIPSLGSQNFLGSRKQLGFLDDYETGSISTRELVRNFNRHYGSALTLGEFVPAWNAMILGFPNKRLEWVRALRSRFRTFLLSNINEIHEAALRTETARHSPDPFEALFEKVYFSHRMGLRKPDEQAFLRVLSENNLHAASTAFIDDSLQHVESAARLGLCAIHLKPGERVEEVIKGFPEPNEC